MQIFISLNALYLRSPLKSRGEVIIGLKSHYIHFFFFWLTITYTLNCLKLSIYFSRPKRFVKPKLIYDFLAILEEWSSIA